MKTNLILAALLASAALVQAGPPITPAKIKKPLHISQVKSIFPHAEPAVPAAPAAPVHKDGATTQQVSAGGATTAAEPVPQPVSKKVHLNTFLNHPKTSPGPK